MEMLNARFTESQIKIATLEQNCEAIRAKNACLEHSVEESKAVAMVDTNRHAAELHAATVPVPLSPYSLLPVNAKRWFSVLEFFLFLAHS